jgi:hypothetical protein
MPLAHLSGNPRGRGWLCLALAAGALTLASPARAAELPTLSIPQVELNGVDAELGQLLGRLLREEVERLGRFRSTGTPRLGLRDLMSAVDCANDSPGCLAAVGRALKVQKLVLGKLDRSGERFLVTLQLFDVGGERIDLRLQKGLVGRDALVAEFPRLVRRFLGLKESEAGSLEVTASQPGVQILLDGVEQGVAPVKIERMAIGEYKVEARKTGFPPFQAVVRVEQDKLSTLAVVLGAEALVPPGGGPAPKRSIKQIRWYTWTLLGVGAGGLIAGGALGGVVLSKQGEFNDLLPAGGRPSGGDYRMAQGLASDGKNLALGSNIAFGVGGAAMLAGAILLWRDLVRPPGEKESSRTASSPASTAFRVQPVASFAAGVTGVTGLTAGIQASY